MPASAPTSSLPTFRGFSTKTVQFYKQIAKNNTREWFEDHRSSYENDVLAPAQAFILELGPRLQKISTHIQFNPDPNGRGSFKKIHTDQRFVKNRPPFKTWMDLMFWEGPIKAKKDNSAFYIRLAPKSLTFMAGIKGFAPNVLANYRQHIADPKRAASLARALTAIKRAQCYTVGGLHYKNVPRTINVTDDYKYSEYFKYNALFAFAELPIPNELFSEKLVDLSLHHFKQLAPLHRWLLPVLASC